AQIGSDPRFRGPDGSSHWLSTYQHYSVSAIRAAGLGRKSTSTICRDCLSARESRASSNSLRHPQKVAEADPTAAITRRLEADGLIHVPTCRSRKHYVSTDGYCCFKHFTKETTMTSRSVHPAPVRTLISPARSSDDPRAAVAAENL